MDMKTFKELRTLRQAAEELGLEYSTIRQYDFAGYLRTIKIGSAKMVTPQEIERFRREGKAKR